MIELFEDAKGEHRFHVKGDNGEIVATSEGYTRKADAARGAQTLVRIILNGLDLDELFAPLSQNIDVEKDIASREGSYRNQAVGREKQDLLDAVKTKLREHGL